MSCKVLACRRIDATVLSRKSLLRRLYSYHTLRTQRTCFSCHSNTVSYAHEGRAQVITQLSIFHVQSNCDQYLNIFLSFYLQFFGSVCHVILIFYVFGGLRSVRHWFSGYSNHVPSLFQQFNINRLARPHGTYFELTFSNCQVCYQFLSRSPFSFFSHQFFVRFNLLLTSILNFIKTIQ